MITETLGYTHHDIEIMSQKKEEKKEECLETKHICICVKTGNVWHCIVYFWWKKSKLLLNLHYLYTLVSSFYLYLLFTFFMNKVCFEQMFRTTTIVLSWLCKTIFSLRRNQKC